MRTEEETYIRDILHSCRIPKLLCVAIKKRYWQKKKWEKKEKGRKEKKGFFKGRYTLLQGLVSMWIKFFKSYPTLLLCSILRILPCSHKLCSSSDFYSLKSFEVSFGITFRSEANPDCPQYATKLAFFCKFKLSR